MATQVTPQGSITTYQSNPLLLSRRDAARTLNLSERKIDLLIRSGELHATRIGRRVMIRIRSLEQLAERGSAGGR